MAYLLVNPLTNGDDASRVGHFSATSMNVYVSKKQARATGPKV